jgi:hypothetical protein
VRDKLLAFKLQHWFVDSRILDAIDADLLLGWAQQSPRRRSVLIAQLVKPRDPLTPLVRGLLKLLGPTSSAAGALSGNFMSGSWWGSLASYETGLLETAKRWAQDPEPSVSAWAREMFGHFERRIPEIRMLEAEGTL